MILNNSSSWGPPNTTPIKDVERVKAEVMSKGFTLVEVDSSGVSLPDNMRSPEERTLAFQPCFQCGGHNIIEETRYERHTGTVYRKYVTRWCEECGIAR
jgi:hypothetical protein